MNPAEDTPQDPQSPRSWLDGPPGPWVAAVLVWLLGTAAAVFQFVQAVVSGTEAYSWFFAALAFVVGLVLAAYAMGITGENKIRKYLVVVLAMLPLLLGSASAGFLIRDAMGGEPPPKPPSIAIAEPFRGQAVGHNPIVKGVVENIPPGKQVWIAVTGQMNTVEIPYQFYVKGNIDQGPCTVAGNSFECNGIFIGMLQDTNRYALIPVIADQSQQSGSQQCMKDNATQVICANIRPDGIRLGAMVFVQRQ